MNEIFKDIFLKEICILQAKYKSLYIGRRRFLCLHEKYINKIYLSGIRMKDLISYFQNLYKLQ